MNEEYKLNPIIVVTALVLVALGGYAVGHTGNKAITTSSTTQTDRSINGSKIHSVESFHGYNLGDNKFQFTYPANWYNDGQYFSPQLIDLYDMYSVRASFYYDFVLADVYDQTALKYQIDNSKRNSPDSHGTIAGKEFKRYDLIDYGSYGGESAGRVIIYIGPKLNINNAQYYLVFHWEEKPLGKELPGNSPEVFEKTIKSLKFGI